MSLADIDIERIARQEYLSWYPGADALAAQWWAEDALATRTSRMRDMRLAVAAIEAAGYTITPPPPPALDAEPGPQVTSVRDRDGSMWRRAGDGWVLAPTPPGGCAVVPWSWVQRYAPLYPAGGDQS